MLIEPTKQPYITRDQPIFNAFCMRNGNSFVIKSSRKGLFSLHTTGYDKSMLEVFKRNSLNYPCD
jgi:hypothetical protein